MPNGEGQDLEEHLVGKYGPSAAQSIHDPNSSVKRMGREMGFEFNMDRRMVNTKRAHAVMEYLKESTNGNGVANLFMEDLYKSYFEDARNINDPTVLLDILLKSKKKYGGVNVEEIKKFLLEDDDDDSGKIEYEITNLDREIKTKYGVRGVPFFMIHPSKSSKSSTESAGGTDKEDDRPVAFSGAYPVEVIAEQLEIAAAAASAAAGDAAAATDENETTKS
mmetsp:Transcript_48496/g.117315  ORF Transcript_48496/g.117315 Transcript_48496/m.117315 type:complete len:221 (-) Transcript_48496:492-1154(-)|eukprot:CAMPEP_0113470002 /NCGR_PEP_ID=MMETSP0014_2-20120614/16207_1 /TAXON_ID=2857 /ORGANISM="Nitzschia sp." /LENGTH=220 /DNA_ID=CAMNT_0000362531 /DNA_START=476 /DNA_END=1138 /DNA_ORIENTATION=- /assembly_acc=CAM_ASM_000159